MFARQSSIDGQVSQSLRLSYLTVVAALSGASLSGCLVGEEELDGEGVSVIQDEISHSGHDYLFVSTPKTWSEAQTYCGIYNNNGGYHLVTVNNSTEENFLDANEASRGLNNWWIGYSDAGIEGLWTWSSGTSSHANWSSGQPDNLGNEDCAVDRFGGSNYWNDEPCTSTHAFICERDAAASGSDGSFTYSKANTSSATTNTAQKTVTLFEQQVFTVGTCGVPGATGSGDTYLRLKDSMGVEVASNDNSGSPCGKLSNISIIVPATGTYVIHAGCYANTTCSGTVVYNY